MIPNTITGLGVITPIGTGAEQFSDALKKGASCFSVMEFNRDETIFRFPAGKTAPFSLKEAVSSLALKPAQILAAKRLRNVSDSTAYGVYTALSAWADADFPDTLDTHRVAIISAGTNTQQATSEALRQEYAHKLHHLNPNYGLNFFDSDIIGILSEILGIRGEGHTVGAASASGNMAIIQAVRLLNSGDYDVVMVVAPLMDLSVYEFQGFTSLGAMARLEPDMDPATLCRPFDKGHNGFVYGQSAACLIIESAAHAQQRNKQGYGSIAGYGTHLDANRNPNPSAEGETLAMTRAITMAGITPAAVDYVNTHGTSSAIGDHTEITAMENAGLTGVKANSTKSLIGHALSAAGVVEAVATLLQMKGNFLHPNNNLVTPVSAQINWIQSRTEETPLNICLSNGFGFGGINTSIIFKK